ncbi:MAG: tetratricopeptide repeat protein [Bacteroidota bacterium]|nr:tetratricopeptide repeat protein [Bacteroidota bacterium]
MKPEASYIKNILLPISFHGKKRVVYLFLLLFISLSTFATNEQLVTEAKQAYDKGKYEQAISNYEKIISSGYSSASLYYNLGNAHYKKNEIGKAIYNYELAHKLDPTDENSKHNLTLANKRTKDQIEQKENYFAKNIESGILNFLSTTGWAWLTIIALTFACLFFILFKITERQKLKRLFFWLGALALIKCVAGFIIGFMALTNIEEKTQAIILSQEVNVMNSPTKDAKSQFSLHEGTKVHVLETNVEWTSISLDNGNEGWLPTKDIGLF